VGEIAGGPVHVGERDHPGPACLENPAEQVPGRLPAGGAETLGTSRRAHLDGTLRKMPGFRVRFVFHTLDDRKRVEGPLQQMLLSDELNAAPSGDDRSLLLYSVTHEEASQELETVKVVCEIAGVEPEFSAVGRWLADRQEWSDEPGRQRSGSFLSNLLDALLEGYR
jgi:hypothetical protein